MATHTIRTIQKAFWGGSSKMKLNEVFKDESDPFDTDEMLQVLFQKMEQMRQRMQEFIRRDFVARVDPSTDHFSQEDMIPPSKYYTQLLDPPTYILKVKDPSLRKEILRVFARFYEIRERWNNLRSQC